MEALILAGIIILFVLVLDARKSIGLLRTRIEELEHHDGPRIVAEPEPQPVSAPVAEPLPPSKPETDKTPVLAKRQTPEPTERKVSQAALSTPPPPAPPPPAPPRKSAAKRFEELIGGKLPIWIGGIALIFAGFFLVRFSIEAGLFGPLARCITAAMFGLLLIGLSEFGNRIPRFGQIFADDVRIGHSLAGAGIAILYATLYMASELYGLMGTIPALVGVILVTVLAFLLSQRHGPPTAIMGLLGGFAAPYVAGLGPESVAPLLIYLGIFTAGLFGLAIYRGWAWLALLATGGSVIWTTALLFVGIGSGTSLVGVFIVLLAIAGVITLTRTGSNFGIPPTIMRMIPLALGLLQLIMLAPLVEFTATSWLFFAVLSAFAIALAWRDDDMTPAVAGALGLCIALTISAFESAGTDRTELIAATGLTLLFGGAGHLFARREKNGWMWALIGIAAPTALLLVTNIFADLDWSDNYWAIACIVVGLTTAIMAWRCNRDQLALPIATAVTALLFASALWICMPDSLAALVAILIAGALAAASRWFNRRAVMVQAVLAVLLGALIALFNSGGLLEALFGSIAGETDLYRHLPDIGPSILELLLPAAGIIAISIHYREQLGRRTGKILAALGVIGIGGFVYLLAKQPLAIGPIETFFAYGFAERAIFTHLLAFAGWLLINRQWTGELATYLPRLGVTLALLALSRFIYFDIFLLSPTAVQQSLGPAPIANLGTLHYAAIAGWLWLYGRSEWLAANQSRFIFPIQIGQLAAAIIAVIVTVRQAVHGSDIASPPYTSTETYLYSAGLLILAIAWLARGIQKGSTLLRIGGLLLLTLVTFKVFLIDAAQLSGILRILSFLGLGIALIGIGWIYGKVMGGDDGEADVEAGSSQG